jgi:PAS domain S-box-containing protein
MVKGIRVTNKQGFKQTPVQQARQGRIVVLSDQGRRGDGLIAMLEGVGYQVEVLHQLSEIHDICAGRAAPLAVILDRVFAQGDNALAHSLAEMQAQCGNRVPVIFVSAQKDIAARLAAYRAGASHYLAKPVVSHRLLRMLDESALLTPAQAYRVMLVDDASAQQAEHALMLRQSGMEVSVVNDPLRVPEMLNKFAADVLVLGMDMAQCSGPELASILHDDPRYASIPVVYLSAESDLLLQLKSIKNSSEHYLSKQVAPGHLVSVISKHAHRHRRSQEKAEVLSAAHYELERQQQAIDAHAIVSVADLDGNIVYVNEKFCQVSGYSSAELIGKNHRIVKSGQHPAEFYADMWHTISGGNIWQGEVCNRGKNGQLYWVETSIIPFLDAEGLPYQYISIRTDITQVKANEIAMQAAKEEAVAASRAKSEFLASMSHELRTPLNAILGFSQLFGMDDKLSEATRKNAKQIERAGHHLLSLVNDLIDLARIESNKMELDMDVVKLKDVVCDSMNMVQSMAHDNSIKIIIMQCDVSDISVWADFNRLRQALINLLTNAIKYNKKHGTVHLLCELVEGRVHIAVTDSGVGIPAAKQERIFHAFDRLGEERGVIEGTGIGLVITKRIVEAMGGSIGFESTPGQGSSFWLDFPLASSNQSALLQPQAPGKKIAGRINAGTQADRPVVLYIEDSEMNLRLMQQIFAAKKEWELRSAATGERGVEMARAEPPGLILLDINLPGIDGYQALKLLHSYPETAHIPVIALTANAMKGEREQGLAAGFVDYLTKPLDVQKLIAVLEKMLD